MIYDLDIQDFLIEDIQHVVHKIYEFYDFEKINGILVFICKTELENDVHFTSNEAHDSFSKLVPKIKSLHNDMYRVIESIYNAKNTKSFKWEALKDKYPLFKEFTFLNNKFKHYKNHIDSKIELTNITHMGETQTMELMFNFFEKGVLKNCVVYQNFVTLFLNYLVDNGKITVD